MTDFNLRAATWDANPTRIERARAVAQGIHNAVPLTPRMTAFEYGCGTGLLSFALQPYLGQITLADNASGMLAVLSEKISAAAIPNMTPLLLDLSADPIPPLRVQLIYTLMTLHHIPDHRRVLRAFHTLLEPGGFLCIADLDKEDGTFHRPEEPVPHHGFDRDDLDHTLREIGFTHIHFNTIFHTPRPINDQIVHFPLFLLVAQKEEIGPQAAAN